MILRKKSLLKLAMPTKCSVTKKNVPFTISTYASLPIIGLVDCFSRWIVHRFGHDGEQMEGMGGAGAGMGYEDAEDIFSHFENIVGGAQNPFARARRGPSQGRNLQVLFRFY